MKNEFNETLIYFIVMLLTFQFSLFFKMFLVYRASIAIAINLILLVFLAVFIYKGIDIFRKLHVEDHEAMTGEIT